jgi:imidazolonepropionase-like amidohydrolase
MKNLKITIVLLLITTIVSAQYRSAKKTHHYSLLKNVSIIDAVGDEGKTGSILIEDDKIKQIAYSQDINIPEGTITYDLKGKYIIPGLIDGHVHITHGTEQEAKEHLKIALLNGVTGVRDMGGDGRMLATLKRNMMIGENIGADVFYSTIIAGPVFFEKDPRPQSVAKGDVAGQVPWQREITHETNFPQIISEVKGIGSTAIKIYANVEPDLIKKVSDEAKKQGLKVWAHAAIPPSKPMDVTQGGAHCISHAGDFLQYEVAKEIKDRHSFQSRDEAMAYRKEINSLQWNAQTPQVARLLKEMKKNNTILDATLFIYDMGLNRAVNGSKIDSSRYRVAMKATKIAYEAGVKINAGSDHMIEFSPYGSTINLHRELELLVKAGLSNMDVIKSATIINAEVLGQEKNIGTIEVGKLANLVVLNANPLENISNTRNIKYVFKRGVLVR